MKKTLTLLIFFLLITGCSSQQGRYQQQHDSTPTRLPSASELIDPVPTKEPISRGGNKAYTVRGKQYQVLPSAENFEETGSASWYGNKFHGHLTSNGEIYNMYAMSAAHKSLPLPTFARVTNLANNKSVIVRVNDRGPFHENRIIDLSYSAAYKLDMLKTGTAKVKITAITDVDAGSNSNTPVIITANNTNSGTVASTVNNTLAENTACYIQVFATRNEQLAQNTVSALSMLYQRSFSWQESEGIFRVQIGPIVDAVDIDDLLITLQQNGYPQAYRRKAVQ